MAEAKRNRTINNGADKTTPNPFAGACVYEANSQNHPDPCQQKQNHVPPICDQAMRCISGFIIKKYLLLLPNIPHFKKPPPDIINGISSHNLPPSFKVFICYCKTLLCCSSRNIFRPIFFPHISLSLRVIRKKRRQYFQRRTVIKFHSIKIINFCNIELFKISPVCIQRIHCRNHQSK